MAGHDGWKTQPRVPSGNTEGGQWTEAESAAWEASGISNPKKLVREHRVLPGTEFTKLPEGTFFYHVSGSDPEDILKSGLLRSSKAAEFSGDEAVNWEIDHPVDGVFLANWGQAKALEDQFSDYGLEAHIYEIYLSKGTVVYKDWMMPETSIQVEGDISTRKITLLEPGYQPWKNGEVTDKLLQRLKWKK